MKRIAAVVGMTTVIMVSLAGHASAKVLEKGTFHEEVNNRVRNFCGASGLTVDLRDHRRSVYDPVARAGPTGVLPGALDDHRGHYQRGHRRARHPG